MAIIRCPGCNQRISSLAGSCAHCGMALADLTPHERDRLALRRWKARLYRARNLTYFAMGMVFFGAVWWWYAPPEGLAPPPPPVATALMGFGLVIYFGGWIWIFWLKLQSHRPG